MRVARGTVYVPIVNVGTQDILLFPHYFRHPGSSGYISLPSEVRSINATGPPAVSFLQEQLEDLDLEMLSNPEKEQVRSLLINQAMFSAYDGDLGCTSLIAHEIPLLDEVPIRQRYRRLPPAEYVVVKTHINQLLEAQVIRESSSPLPPPLSW